MNQERLMQILLTPHVSEKASVVADANGQHVFKVLKDANKTEIKQAVESLFEVKVAQVRVMNVKGKTKRFSNREGKRSDWRKAYVTLEKGQDIDFASAS